MRAMGVKPTLYEERAMRKAQDEQRKKEEQERLAREAASHIEQPSSVESESQPTVSAIQL